MAWHRQYPGDWRRCGGCSKTGGTGANPVPSGALEPFNIDAKLNGAYIALGLLYGHGDFGKTLEVSHARRAGFRLQSGERGRHPRGHARVRRDSGGMEGRDRGDRGRRNSATPISTSRRSWTARRTRTLALVVQTGGRVEGESVDVRAQEPKALKVKVWDNYGSPVERINSADPRWTWTGEWSTQTRKGPDNGPGLATHRSAAKGAEAVITFEGNGAIVAGPYLANGGTLEVYLDGKPDRKLDVYSDERTDKTGEAVWHAFGLKRGKHTVRLVVLGERYGDSGGADVAVEDLVVFR